MKKLEIEYCDGCRYKDNEKVYCKKYKHELEKIWVDPLCGKYKCAKFRICRMDAQMEEGGNGISEV